MKRMSFLLVMVAIVVVMSAPIFGQEKNQSLIASWTVEPSQAMVGQPVTLTAVVANGTPPYKYYFNGNEIDSVYIFIPDSTADYQAKVVDARGMESPYAFTLPVFTFISDYFSVLTLEENVTDITEAIEWSAVAKKIAELYQNGDFEITIIGVADVITTQSSRAMKGKASIDSNRAYQQRMADRRAFSAYKALGIKNAIIKTQIERPRGSRGVEIYVRETKASLTRRFLKARQAVASSNSNRTVKLPADSSQKPSKTPVAIRWMMDNLAIGLGQQFGGYTGPVASLSAKVWGNPDSTGWSFNLTGTMGWNSYYHDFTETYGVDAIVRYNLRPWLGAGFSAGYFKWSDVINQAKDPNYKDYKREFAGPVLGSWLFVGPVYGNIGWANGRHDDRRKCLPDVRDHVWDRVYRVGIDPIKTVKMIF